jgi:shikimate kinase
MQRLFLTGLSGSGKSTVGRRVAALLNWDFIDTDQLLAQSAGLPVGQLLTDYGEERFRQLESEALKAATAHEQVVIATGGGMVISEVNRALMQTQGLTIYLRTTVEMAWQRVQAQLSADGKLAERPLLAGADGQQRLHDLLNTRAAWYEQAPVQITTDEATYESVAQQVLVSSLAKGLLLLPQAARVSLNLRLAAARSQAVIEWGSFCHLPEAIQALDTQGRVFIVTETGFLDRASR